MKEVSKTCDLKTLKDSPNATSSQASAYGHMPCEKQDGLTTDLCGQEVVLANLSARQAKERGLLTSGTYGPRSTTLSASADLLSSLVNKLQAKTASLGSTLYRLTWKDRVTPGGLPIPALRASVLRTSDKDCTGLELTPWVTPAARDWKDVGDLSKSQYRKDGKERLDTISRQVALAGWPTPRVGGNGAASSTRTGTRGNIEQAAWLAGWPTPCASKTGKNSKDPQRMKEKGRDRKSTRLDSSHL